MSLDKLLSDITMDKILKYVKLDENKKAEIYYGISVFYINLLKTSLIIISALFMNILKETMIFYGSFALIRIFAFGIHAEKSIHCTISNFLAFIGGTLICIHINLSSEILYTLSILTLILLILYAPADTKARPLTDEKQRIGFKIKSICMFSLLFLLSLLLKNNIYINLITVAMFFEALNITPLAYHIFNKPYNNFQKQINID